MLADKPKYIEMKTTPLFFKCSILNWFVIFVKFLQSIVLDDPVVINSKCICLVFGLLISK